MTELFFVILQFFIIYFLFYFNLLIVLNNNLFLNNISSSENISFNSIIFLNIILIVSFFNTNLNTIIICYFSYLFFLIVIYFYKFKSLIVDDNESLLYFLIFFITSIVIFIEVANNLVIGWDAEKFWIQKAISFYNGNTITNLSNLPNSFYPYLGSLSWSFFWKISFLENEYSGRLFYVFIYLSSLLLLINNFKFSILYKIIFFIFFIILSYDYTYHSHWSMFSGYQDILIFSLVTMAMHFFYKLSNFKGKLENFNILSILLICNLLVWIKLEGFIISSSLIFTLLIFFNLKIEKKISIFMIFLLIIFLRFFIFDLYNLNSTNIQHTGFIYQNLKDILETISITRFLIVFKYLILNLLTNYLAIISIFIVSILLITRQNFKKMYHIMFLILFNIIIFCGIYLITSSDLVEMLKTGMDRILYQLSPFFLLLFLEFYNSKKIK